MENLKAKKYFSIKTKITFSIVFFVFIILTIVFVSTFFYLKKHNRDDFKSRLLDIVSISSLQINGDEHKVLQTISDEELFQYKNIVSNLKDIQKNSSDIYYIYTMRKNINDEITFIVDPDDADPSTISHIGTPYEDASPFLKDNFTKIDKAVVENDFYTDQWGTWLSGYAPIYTTDAKKEGVLGVDINATSLINKENNLLIILFITYIFSLFLSIILGLYLSGKSSNLIKLIIS